MKTFFSRITVFFKELLIFWGGGTILAVNPHRSDGNMVRVTCRKERLFMIVQLLCADFVRRDKGLIFIDT